MADALISNPILNSPFREPTRHFRFTEDGITNEILAERRSSSYFVPIPQPRKKSKQQTFDTEWTQDRIEENKVVNRIRLRVKIWREGEYRDVTATTRRLLQHWTDPDRENRLFFCQIEALETVIYLTEVARKYGDAWIENDLTNANEGANPGLFRVAMKMATGSGKTVVMAMLIAWHALNKAINPKDKRFSDTFLIVTPGITIRDRLRVLLPNDPASYYRQRDLIPPDFESLLGRAKVLITNYHAFQQLSLADAGKLTKAILNNPFKETPAQMVNRVCREFGSKRGVVVINDEAHHCYRRRPPLPGEVQTGAVEDEPLKGEDRVEAERRDEEARIWLTGLEAVQDKLGIRTIYDLSATPFFLRGSGYREGTLFPWVVSDFSLIDAIESGIVKIPRVPVADDSMMGSSPTYRDLWHRIRDDLPKKGRKTEQVEGDPSLPTELEAALRSLYSNYEHQFRRWEASGQTAHTTPPVFIVVCNNTNVSNLVFKFISGYDRTLADGSKVAAPGALKLFSNVDEGGRWRHQPYSILVDSQQLESGDGMSDDFKKAAAREIEEFYEEYRTRFPDRDIAKLTDEDLLREVMNTVGKPGRLGETVRCVVSVSMLTEGWDVNTVTHILGVRAFGTQLLCEQVVGRGLRRMSYSANSDGHFDPEYADVYGVPFSFIPCAGGDNKRSDRPPPTRVQALASRAECEIAYPRLLGYKYEVPSERISAKFSPDSGLALSTADIPTKTELSGVIGEKRFDTLEDLKRIRTNEIAFQLAKLLLETRFNEKHPDGTVDEKPWLFPQLLGISKRWMAECLTCKGGTFPQLLRLVRFAHDAAGKIYNAIVAAEPGEPRLKPILKPYDAIGHTRYVDFHTLKETYSTRADRCHISHVVGDSGWEFKMARTLEDMDEVRSYVKNQHLGFTIPYIVGGVERQYHPDFLIRFDDGRGKDEGDLLTLILEVTGERDKDKAEKAATARTLWVPAVNNHGGFGRWAYLEIADPYDDCEGLIRAFVKG